MIRRAVSLPADAPSVWRAITESDALESWFGSSVEWDLRPGGRAHFRPAEGGEREGVIDAVEPGRRLRFRWWPADGSGDVSEIAYELEPDDVGTSLTVTERQVTSVAAAPEGAPATSGRGPADGAPAARVATASPGRWSATDQMAWEEWVTEGGVARSSADRRLAAPAPLAVCCAR